MRLGASALPLGSVRMRQLALDVYMPDRIITESLVADIFPYVNLVLSNTMIC
jgi:hypothetical protein